MTCPNKVPLVTGGNGGIGRSITKGLAQHGADIVLAALNEQKTEAVVKEIEAMGRRCIGVYCDVLEGECQAPISSRPAGGTFITREFYSFIAPNCIKLFLDLYFKGGDKKISSC